jgi:hypothetical protein
MTPRKFTTDDMTYAKKLMGNFAHRYPDQFAGFTDLISTIEREDDDCLMIVGSNFIITSMLEPVPSVLPRDEWRQQQMFGVTCVWEDFNYGDGYADTCEKDVGTFPSLGKALQAIALDIIELDVNAIWENTNYPDEEK